MGTLVDGVDAVKFSALLLLLLLLLSHCFDCPDSLSLSVAVAVGGGFLSSVVLLVLRCFSSFLSGSILFYF